MDGVIVIAVDGPVAAGKGTLARHLATRTGLRHPRQRHDLPGPWPPLFSRPVMMPETRKRAGQRAERLVAADLERPGLRDQEIGSVSSRIAAHREVRAALVEFQRRFGATPPGAVIDGRDIGTVVFPDADLKFFVTAHVRARARRRHRELVSRGVTIDFHSVLHEISERDRRDSERTWAPLRQADDAVVIDTTALDARAVAEKALDIVRQRLGAATAFELKIIPAGAIWAPPHTERPAVAASVSPPGEIPKRRHWKHTHQLPVIQGNKHHDERHGHGAGCACLHHAPRGRKLCGSLQRVP